MLNILLVFPDGEIKNLMKYDFESDKNYNIKITSTITEALDLVRENDFDVILSEMKFSDGSGLDFKKKLNEIKDIPTIFVSEINDNIQKVLALEYGADDYVISPFYMLELKARMRAIMRRYSHVSDDSKEISNPNIIKIGAYEFNIVGRRVKIDDIDIGLTGREFDLLFMLISNCNSVFSRQELAQQIWGDKWEGHLRTVDVHIKRLRQKLGEDRAGFVKTKWGEGYYYGEDEGIQI